LQPSTPIQGPAQGLLSVPLYVIQKLDELVNVIQDGQLKIFLYMARRFSWDEGIIWHVEYREESYDAMDGDFLRRRQI